MMADTKNIIAWKKGEKLNAEVDNTWSTHYCNRSSIGLAYELKYIPLPPTNSPLERSGLIKKLHQCTTRKFPDLYK